MCQDGCKMTWAGSLGLAAVALIAGLTICFRSYMNYLTEVDKAKEYAKIEATSQSR